MKRSNGINFLKFSVENVLKLYGKRFLKVCGNHDLGHGSV